MCVKEQQKSVIEPMRLHLRPLGVRQHESFHPKLESQSSLGWNPNSQQAWNAGVRAAGAYRGISVRV
jgi:hypothetical protein